MARLRVEPVQVRADARGMPVELRRRRWLGVSVVDHWVDTGCWWEGETEKQFYRVETTTGIVLELYWERSGDRWFIYKTYD